jgi:hypothetical protein
MGRAAKITWLSVVIGIGLFLWPTHITVLGTTGSCGIGPVAVLRSSPVDSFEKALSDECRSQAILRGGMGLGVIVVGAILGAIIGPTEIERRRILALHVGRRFAPEDPYLRCFECDRSGGKKWPCQRFLKAGGTPPAPGSATADPTHQR